MPRAANSEIIPIAPEEMTSQIRNRKAGAENNLRLLNNGRVPTEEEMIEKMENRPRQKYAAMAAHKELAAQAMAVGSTQKMAARYAGVAPRQIKKYLADPDFRVRITELRNLLAGKIQGKILREFNRRVTGTAIKNMETMDLTRIFDRVTEGGKGMRINIEGDVVGGSKYESILEALFTPNPGTEGEDFPVYGDSDLQLSSGRPSESEEVSTGQWREADREE